MGPIKSSNLHARAKRATHTTTPQDEPDADACDEKACWATFSMSPKLVVTMRRVSVGGSICEIFVTLRALFGAQVDILMSGIEFDGTRCQLTQVSSEETGSFQKKRVIGNPDRFHTSCSGEH
jgi:hypothetical protein